MILRPEQANDCDAIHQLIAAAFKGVAYSDQSEPYLVRRLRDQGGLSLSLVAEAENGVIIGHIAFSKVLINGGDMNWYGLAPVSVRPSHQGQGVGSALINAGLMWLEKTKAAGCVLLGEPDYYQRFGFEARSELVLSNVPPEFFMARLITAEGFPQGHVQYHKAFGLED